MRVCVSDICEESLKGRRSDAKYCSDQCLKREANRRYRERNREKVLEWKRRYREQNREKELERYGRYYEQNRGKVLERRGRYYEQNRGKVLERRGRYHEQNREYRNSKTADYTKERQARSKETAIVSGPWSPTEDRIVLSPELTTFGAALALRRTYSSVGNRRSRLRRQQQAA